MNLGASALSEVALSEPETLAVVEASDPITGGPAWADIAGSSWPDVTGTAWPDVTRSGG